LPTDHAFVSPPIPAWVDANRSIDVSHPRKQTMKPGDAPRLKTVLPDPAAVVCAPDPARQSSYLAQYAHIRDLLVIRSRVEGGNEVPVPLRASVWRKALSVPFHGMYDRREQPDAKNKQARDHLEASEWLEELFKTYRPDATPAASKDSAVEPQLARKLVFELCAVNFRYQLMGLDEL
ncbi:hypothetical protein V5O48_019646, partial [Marasmius crinis-equi]